MAAKHDVEAIHGIIFPEYALDWESYQELVHTLSKTCPKLEFIVAGASENCGSAPGNFAFSTVFTHKEGQNGDGSVRYGISTSRSKHHRWRLDEGQISTYALASALDPRYVWWEDIPLSKREVHVNVFRDTSTFAAMICEDLARVDPCHPILRAMAPSLVFVLLMDGPQIPERWSARYATALAEDPGSSVLTLTSAALMRRSNQTRSPSRPENWSIALWRDDSGRSVPIVCDDKSHGVVLTLSGYRTTEVSLDGRANPLARAWRYHGHQPVRVDPKAPALDVDEGDDLSLEEVVRLVTGLDERIPPRRQPSAPPVSTPETPA
ncbi:hypothetical protein [Pararhodospirillum oryzae]|uniref:CN hydrolase domain-containing protein n=1 Tax=Pararhodospirillum oryzae TaxID=478448 RepID=A0A512H411_9PROT|nr:hypothetical protein [Pararhodospirillum oryzae]GEO80206.1 hypothetical protein ROR02_03370 [Pararhodospirillum oryzae]